MSVGSLAPRLRPVASDESHRVTTLELYFDLAFVFAFTQLSRLMAQQHDALGVLQALVILVLLWWSWTAYSWLANLTHADEGVVRAAMIVAMIAILVAGLVVPEAYDDLPGGLFAPIVFVGAYLVARVAHAIVFVWVSEPTLRRRSLLTVALSVIPSGLLLTAGALLGGAWQLWCGLIAVAIEPIVAYRTSAGVDWRIRSTKHFTERYGLVVILALGESVIAIGVGVAAEPMSMPILVGVVLAMLISVGLWWAYFSPLARKAEQALAERRGTDAARTASEGYTYLHLILVAGIVLAALGVETAMAHIAGPEPLGLFGAAALGGGISCFLAGTGFFARRVLGHWSIPRFTGATAMLLAVAPLAAVSPIVALSIAATLLVALLVAERWLGRRAVVAGRFAQTAPDMPIA